MKARRTLKEQSKQFRNNPMRPRAKRAAPAPKPAAVTDTDPVQTEMLIETQAVPENLVRNGRLLVNFVRPVHELDGKDDKRTVGFQISLALTDEHEGLLPAKVEKWWEEIREGGAKQIDITGVDPHSMTLSFEPESDDRDLQLDVVTIGKARLAVIEEKGSGDAVETIRFSFTAYADLTKKVNDFAGFHYGKSLWMELKKVQGDLF